MQRILSLIPENSWHLLERYLLEMAAEIRAKRNSRHMSEVCVRSRNRLAGLRQAARRAADLPDDQAIAAICAAMPGILEAQARAHLDLARRKLKAERRADRDRTIASLTHQGYRNADIARAAGVSLTTAARKAARALKGEKP